MAGSATGPARRVVLATDDGIHLVAAVDDPASVSSPQPGPLAGRHVDDLAGHGGGWWAVTDGTDLWQEPASGSVRHVVSVAHDVATCLLPWGDGALVGTEAAHLVRVAGSTVARLPGFDEAESRSTWYTPWGGPPAVRTLAAADDGTLYANVHVGGILRSDDGGTSWRPTIDVDADVHEVTTVPGQPDTVVAAAARGLARSTDRGRTWTVTDAGLHATYCRAVAVGAGTVYVSASTGPSSQQAAVYRGDLAGDRLVRCATGLPEWFAGNVDSRCLAAAGDTAVIGAPDGDVYVSGDRGGSWARLPAGLPTIRAVALV